MSGLNLGAFFNVDFQRGRIDYLSRIKRIVPSRNSSSNNSIDPRMSNGERPPRLSTGLEPSFFLKRSFDDSNSSSSTAAAVIDSNTATSNQSCTSGSSSPTNSSRYNNSSDRSVRSKTEPSFTSYAPDGSLWSSLPSSIPNNLQLTIPGTDSDSSANMICYSSKTTSTGRTSMESAGSIAAFSDDGSCLLDTARPSTGGASVAPIPAAIRTPPSSTPDAPPIVPPLGLSALSSQPTYFSASASQPPPLTSSISTSSSSSTTMMNALAPITADPSTTSSVVQTQQRQVQVDVFKRPTRLPVPQPSVLEISIDPAVLRQYGEVYFVPPEGGHPIRIKASFATPLSSAAAPALAPFPCILPPMNNFNPGQSTQQPQPPRKNQQQRKQSVFSQVQSEIEYFHSQASGGKKQQQQSVASSGRRSSLSPIAAVALSPRHDLPLHDFLLDSASAGAVNNNNHGFADEFLPLDLEEPLLSARGLLALHASGSKSSRSHDAPHLHLSESSTSLFGRLHTPRGDDQRFFLDGVADDVEGLDEANMSMEERDLLRSLFADMH